MPMKSSKSVRSATPPYSALIYEQVARKLRTLRKRKGMSVREVAERCDMHPSNYTKIEAGEREPRIGTFFRILRALDSNVIEFVQARAMPRKE